MSRDARFEEAGDERPLRLKAESAEDLEVISSLVQDAVGKAGDISWLPKQRRLILAMNRFRWEAHAGAPDGQAPAERVRSALSIDSVLKVRARGIDQSDKTRVYDLLALSFTPGTDAGGVVTLTLAGGSAFSVEVECLDLMLADIGEPWGAKAGRAPNHDA
ncbi:MAG: DUF2948 family protein [Paracoccaceae bacterium]|nr:DUF2948 family protein [Paracoccaceae bacterium]